MFLLWTYCAQIINKDGVNMTNFKLNTVSFRKVPLFENNTENVDSNQIKRYVAIVPVEELRHVDFPTDTNPRYVNEKTDVAKDIKNSLIENFEFHILNRGIFLSAYSVKHDRDEKILEIDFSDDTNLYGIVDGGHTYKIIKDALISNSYDLSNRFVNIEIFTGFDSTSENFIVKFAGARNTSMQVSTSSLEELQGNFQFIKDGLKTMKYGDNIAYKQFDNKHLIDIREIVCLMTLFDIETYKITDTSKEPNIAYSGKESCLNKFGNACKEEKQSNQNIYRKIANILPEILEAADHIKSRIYTIWNRKLGGQYKNLIFNKAINEKLYHGLSAEDFPFIGEEAFSEETELKDGDKILIPRPFWLPILASLRVLITEKNGLFITKMNLKKFFDSYQAELVGIVKDTFAKSNLNMMGKDKIFWQNLHRESLIRAIQDGLIKL